MSLVAIVVPSIVPLLISAFEITTLPVPLGVKEISPFAPLAIVISPDKLPSFVCNVKLLAPQVVIAAFMLFLPVRTVLHSSSIVPAEDKLISLFSPTPVADKLILPAVVKLILPVP